MATIEILRLAIGTHWNARQGLLPSLLAGLTAWVMVGPTRAILWHSSSLMS